MPSLRPPALTACLPARRSTALVDLAASARSAGWKSKKNWLKDVSVCEWYGVTCSKGRVTGLALHANNLAGSLPASLGGLS